MTMQKAHHGPQPTISHEPSQKSPSKSASKSVPKSASKRSLSPRRRALPSLPKSTSHSAPKTVTRTARMWAGGTTLPPIHRNACSEACGAPAKLVRSPSGARKTELAPPRRVAELSCKTVGLTPVNQAYYSSVARK
jgi:hypothetical protein